MANGVSAPRTSRCHHTNCRCAGTRRGFASIYFRKIHQIIGRFKFGPVYLRLRVFSPAMYLPSRKTTESDGGSGRSPCQSLCCLYRSGTVQVDAHCPLLMNRVICECESRGYLLDDHPSRLLLSSLLRPPFVPHTSSNSFILFILCDLSSSIHPRSMHLDDSSSIDAH
jgi:hypothetical protein